MYKAGSETQFEPIRKRVRRFNRVNAQALNLLERRLLEEDVKLQRLVCINLSPKKRYKEAWIQGTPENLLKFFGENEDLVTERRFGVWEFCMDRKVAGLESVT